MKRRLVDQGLWFNAGGTLVPARFSCCMTLHICIKPPAQRRMGGKRRLVDQGLWFNAGGTLVPARFSCCMTLHICGAGTAKFDR